MPGKLTFFYRVSSVYTTVGIEIYHTGALLLCELHSFFMKMFCYDISRKNWLVTSVSHALKVTVFDFASLL